MPAESNTLLPPLLITSPFALAGASFRSWSFTATDAAKAILAKAESELQFLMDEAGVSEEIPGKVYKCGFTSARIYAGLDDTKEAARKGLAKELPLDYEASADNRAAMALLLSVWETCRTQLTVNEKHRADAKLGAQTRVVPTTEYAAMRQAIENIHGTLHDKELPSKSLVAQKLEQIEDNAPHYVEDLREVTSLEVGAYETVIDPASTFLRIKPGKTITSPQPSSFVCAISASASHGKCFAQSTRLALGSQNVAWMASASCPTTSSARG